LNDPTQIVSLEQLRIDIKPLKKEQDKLIYNYLLAKLDYPEVMIKLLLNLKEKNLI